MNVDVDKKKRGWENSNLLIVNENTQCMQKKELQKDLLKYVSECVGFPV